MSVYRRDGDKTYSFDFRWRGHRFSGQTGETDKRRAEAWEKAERERIKAAAIDPRKPLTFAAAATLYWQEVGQHHANSIDTQRSLGWLQEHIGMRTLITTVSDDTVSRLVVQRRAEGVTPATINRTVTIPLRAILTRAERVWKRGACEVTWSRHMLREPQERIRELTAEEETRLFAALAPGYREISRFALLSGCRMAECLALEWRRIDWQAGYIVVTGKGEKTRHIPLHAKLRDLLWPLQRANTLVFTHELRRHSASARKGERVPIEREALKIHFRRTVARLGISDFTFHDLRHTCATRLLRASGNLRLVKDLLGHANIETTLKYAHANHHDMRAALDATFPTEITTEPVGRGASV